MKKSVSLLAMLFAAVLLVAGCAKPPSRCTSPEDNPLHHYLKGMTLLEKASLDEAYVKFERSLYCDEEFSLGHAGMAIVEAQRSRAAGKQEGYRKVDADKALDHLKSAAKGLKTEEERFGYRLASMRVNTALKLSGWLEQTEQDYKEAMRLKVEDKKILYYDGREAAPYFMGTAHLDAGEFQKARDSFSDVLNTRAEGKWNALADKQWKKVDKIVRALSGVTVGDVGRKIAVLESVNRGDMAALISDELKIEKLFAGRIPVASAEKKPDFIPADALGNPFKEEIATVLKWNVRGLEPIYDETTRAYLYKPSLPVTRKEFAFLLEDVLIKITGDEKMATAFFGHEKSPFPDISPASAWYNAVMNVTTRNIMEADLSGEFRPADHVSGAEAILAIRVLRQRLNIH